jgi:hypothetical protein
MNLPSPHRAADGDSLRRLKRISMPREGEQPRALNAAQVEQFIQDGFVRIDQAFPRQLAEAARAILWRDLPAIAMIPPPGRGR